MSRAAEVKKVQENEAGIQAEKVREIETGIRIELAEEPNRGSSVDRDTIRGSFRASFGPKLAAAEPLLRTLDDDDEPVKDDTLVPTLRAFGVLVTESIARLDDLVLAHPTTTIGNQRYSPQAHGAAGPAFRAFTRIRRKVDKRLSNLEVDKRIKVGCSVGATVTPEVPIDVRDRLARMIATLSDKQYADRFKARDIDSAAILPKLRRQFKILDPAVQARPGTPISRGENSDLIDKELVFLDVAFERLVSFLEDHAPEEIAAAIEGLVPRNRRAGDGGKKEEVVAPVVGEEKPASDGVGKDDAEPKPS